MHRTSLRMLIGILLGLLGTAVYAQSATPNAPVTPIYGPPYHARQMPDYSPGLPNDSVAAAVSQWWAAYQVYWAYAFPGCSYTTQTYSPSIANGGLELGLTLHGTCGGGQGFYGTKQCPPGYKLSGNTCVGDKQVAITPSNPFIPVGSGVVDDHVLTVSSLDLLVTQGSDPLAGIPVPLQSDRGTEDQIDNPSVTNSGGEALAFVSTRNQPGTSTITSATTDITTSRPGVINWLPAKYESNFLVTCYGVANQTYQTSGPMVTIPGLPGTYHQQFYNQIIRQGSGVISDTTKAKRYIQRLWIDPATGKHYKGMHYGFFKCPYTARGDCATAGETIAVDPTVIPMNRKHDMYANVSISGVGDRTSEDGGQWVGGYHIDVFWGKQWEDYEACTQWGRNGPTGSPHTVIFENYVH